MVIAASQLAFLPFKDQQALLDWNGEHSQLHKKIQAKAVQDGHTNLGTYDVADMADFDDFIFFHNEEHAEISNTYNLAAPPDLGFWDLENEVNFYSWLQAHALTHQSQAQGLGL